MDKFESLIDQLDKMINHKENSNKNEMKNILSELFNLYNVNKFKYEKETEELKRRISDCNQVRDRQYERIKLLEKMLQAVIDKDVI